MARIKIRGMSCQHCVMAVKKALGGIDGIKDVSVDLEKGEADVYRGEACRPDAHPGADSESGVRRCRLTIR